MPLVIKLRGDEKPAELCCVCSVYQRARMNFDLNVSMYNSLKNRQNLTKIESLLNAFQLPEFKNSSAMIEHEAMAYFA